MNAIDYFRKPSDKDNEIFMQALQLKEQANALFNESEETVNGSLKNVFYFFDTRYIPLKDSDKPTELNVYIRKIETIYRETTDIDNIPINPNDEKIDVVEEWTKSYLPNDIVDDLLFYRYLKVIHCLRYIHSLSDKFKKNKSVIFINLELLCKSEIDNSFSLSQLEDEIYDLRREFYTKADENGWVVVESYKDFLKKNDLLNWLDNKNSQEKTFMQIFSSDFVFLNNTDNINGESDSSIIRPHILLENPLDVKNKLFCYTRSSYGSRFIRNTIFFPKKYCKEKYIKEFSTLVRQIINNKEHKDVR